VAEHFHERVLDGFVSFGGVPEILESDAKCPALVCNDKPFEALSSFIKVAALDELPNVDGQT